MTLDTRLYIHPTMTLHDPGHGHPESPQRLKTLYQSLEESPISGTAFVQATPASKEAIARIHQEHHIQHIEEARGRQSSLDADTSTSEKSVEAAYLAAGAGVQVIDDLLSGQTKTGFVLSRPPGHHAEADRVMGFCLFNTIAVAAAQARSKGIERILIVDWDVHHGNGTQHSFYEDPYVLVFNTHQFPFYPGTGRHSEVGGGDGRGFTVNCPLPAGMADGDYLKVFEEVLVPVAESYKPQLILVSAGFDAHIRDPLGAMNVSEDGYADLCGMVLNLAQRFSDGRLALFLEGGYDLQGLEKSVRSCIQVLTGKTPPQIKASAQKGGDKAIEFARAAQAPYWSL
ncbi:MAG: histone deacetylase [Planctomycetota bacterium]|nr:histone deacetylase [Planctomycetota bacterium]